MYTILMIEDEQDVRSGILKALAYEGYGTLGANNGQMGIELARKHLPDLIICDIMMPERDGYSVLIELRRDPYTATIPFIFLTAMTARKNFQNGIQLGADAYLTKPFDIAELVNVVNTLILRKETDLSKQLDTLRINLARTLPPDLQVPLTGIIGFSGILVESGLNVLPEPDDLLDMQTYIYENALRMQRRMSNYLLYYELKLLQYEPARKNEWQQCESIMTKDIISASVRKKAQEFDRQEDVVLELAETETQMPAESAQKIVEELLDNAFHFSEPGTPVHVMTAIDENQWMLKIIDRGCGMTTEQLANLKQRSGLGLTISHLLVQLHNGKLIIESESNQGTTVTVVFREHKNGTYNDLSSR